MPSIRRQRGATAITWLLGLVVTAVVVAAIYLWLMLSWSYSEGERAGWVQKLSKKGFLCKTWEGEMAMVSMPGAIPEKFIFTIRDDAVANQLNAVMGKRVALRYTEHIGLLTSCFGDTRYFVDSVKAIEEMPALLPQTLPQAPTPPAPTPAPAAPQPKP